MLDVLGEIAQGSLVFIFSDNNVLSFDGKNNLRRKGSPFLQNGKIGRLIL